LFPATQLVTCGSFFRFIDYRFGILGPCDFTFAEGLINMHCVLIQAWAYLLLAIWHKSTVWAKLNSTSHQRPQKHCC